MSFLSSGMRDVISGYRFLDKIFKLLNGHAHIFSVLLGDTNLCETVKNGGRRTRDQ